MLRVHFKVTFNIHEEFYFPELLILAQSWLHYDSWYSIFLRVQFHNSVLVTSIYLTIFLWLFVALIRTMLDFSILCRFIGNVSFTLPYYLQYNFSYYERECWVYAACCDYYIYSIYSLYIYYWIFIGYIYAACIAGFSRH